MSEKCGVKDEKRLLNFQDEAQKSLPTEEGKARGKSVCSNYTHTLYSASGSATK